MKRDVNGAMLVVLRGRQPDRHRHVADVWQMQVAQSHVKGEAAPRPLLLRDRGKHVAQHRQRRLRRHTKAPLKSYVGHAYLLWRYWQFALSSASPLPSLAVLFSVSDEMGISHAKRPAEGGSRLALSPVAT